MEGPVAVFELVSQKILDSIRLFSDFVRRVTRRLGIPGLRNAVLYFLRVIHCERIFLRGKTPTESLEPHTPLPFYALIIGINKYKSTRIPDLRGAALDADSVDEYVRTVLRIPVQQIVNLRDGGATREAIIRELRALITRRAVNKRNAILIFYAGYGASVGAPKGWAVGSENISLILPHDSLIDADSGQRVHPIPDRTIGALLHGLSEQNGDSEKGDNVVLILDCCYSSATTNLVDSVPSRRMRGFRLEAEDSIPADLDESIWGNLSGKVFVTPAPETSYSARRSHVTLSACHKDGAAQEVGARGLFTHALLEALRGVSTEKVTYRDVMRRIPNLPGQTPLCGDHLPDQLFFNSLVPGKERTLYPVSLKDDAFVIDAGFLQGVGYDTEFVIYAHGNPADSGEPLTTMIPKSVRASSADLRYLSSSPPLDFDGSSSYFAAQSSIGKVAGLRLHVTPSEPESRRSILEALSKVYQPRTSGPAILLVDDAAHADLSILSSTSEVQYIIHEPLITACGLSGLRQSTTAETKAIYPVFRAAAHFFRFLRFSPNENRLRDLVHVEVYALEIDEEGELGPDLRRPWVTCGSSLYDSGFVDVVADDDTAYGIKVRNDSNTSFHVWAFYFDCSGLAISEYYKPPTIGGAEPSLPARGALTIGYGAGGGLPYTFFLREGQNLDVGFIKLFISPEPVDFSSIEQRSPFKDPIARGKRKPSAEFEVGWDTVTIAVVQRKP
ncbi:hypothetical protein PENSPDRAFT_682235 [Peniophora sp. CONT]|nr:hypothetical protein PENSPDRAFT_682235 [Peniophora sp. CONT]